MTNKTQLGSQKRDYIVFFAYLLMLLLPPAVGASFAWETPFQCSTWPLLSLCALATALSFYAYRTLRPRLPRARTLWLLLLISAGINACVNYSALGAPWQFALSLSMAMGALCLTWALLRGWAVLFWLPFLFLQSMQVIGNLQYGSIINSLVIAETLEGSAGEFAAYLTPATILQMLFLLMLLAGLCWCLHHILRKAARLQLLRAGFLFSTCSYLFGISVPTGQQQEGFYWPWHELYRLGAAVHEALAHNEATVREAETLPSPADTPSRSTILNGNEGLVLILHIGESIRADRMGINGYTRPTTPYLQSLMDEGAGIINFPHCISAASDTCQAQICILTDARRAFNSEEPNMRAKAGSILELFNAHKFKLFAFFGERCGQQLKYDRVIRVFTRAAQERFNAPGSPWTGIPQIEQVLRQQGSADNLLFFINNEGSHTPFSHYDPSTAPFMPAGSSFEAPAQHAQEVNNAYDNTIHYTDEYIRRVCHLLKGRPYLYLYVSDHGEYLGENGMWGRAALGARKGLYHETQGSRVGMFALYSPEFQALHPLLAQALNQVKEHRQLVVAHEHIYHTLLGLMGIVTPYYDATLDLSSPRVRPYTGPQPDSISNEH